MYIHFASNKITNIGPNILSHLKNLKNAYFTSNTCAITKNAETQADLILLKTELETKCPPTNEMWLSYFAAQEKYQKFQDTCQFFHHCDDYEVTKKTGP
jgi:hypothetical protein